MKHRSHHKVPLLVTIIFKQSRKDRFSVRKSKTSPPELPGLPSTLTLVKIKRRRLLGGYKYIPYRKLPRRNEEQKEIKREKKQRAAIFEKLERKKVSTVPPELEYKLLKITKI